MIFITQLFYNPSASIKSKNENHERAKCIEMVASFLWMTGLDGSMLNYQRVT